MTHIPLSTPDVGRDEQDAALQALKAGDVAMGPQVAAFENAFAQWARRDHALATSSGTAALHLALRLLDIGPGDAVIAPSLTFIGGVAPIFYQGAAPIFVDSGEADWNLDPTLLPQAFDRARSLGLKVRAVMPADLYGQCCDIGSIADIAAAHGAVVILDSAEAVGARRGDLPAGSGAWLAAYSFNGNKIITTGGGGMLVGDDEAMIEHARRLSAASREPAAHYEHREVGYNYRLGAVAAAIGLAQLKRLEDMTARRRAVFRRYVEALGDLPGLTFAPEAPGRLHTRWLTVARLDPAHAPLNAEELRLSLAAADIESRPVWKPMHLQPVFRDAPYIGGAVAQALFQQGLCLPSSSSLSAGDQDRVIAAVLRAWSENPS